MFITKKHIITGAPGTGKSTLLQELHKQGYSVIQEVSREVIIAQQLQEGTAFPWENTVEYAAIVFTEIKKRLQQHSNALFIDRSVVDLIAYLQFYGYHVSKDLLNFPFHDYFHSTVFVAPSWEEIYTTDPQRPQQYQELEGLEEMLIQTYQKLGFTCVYLPKSHLVQRAQFVIQQINSVVSV